MYIYTPLLVKELKNRDHPFTSLSLTVGEQISTIGFGRLPLINLSPLEVFDGEAKTLLIYVAVPE